MAKSKTKYVCSECGYEIGKWFGKCPSCGMFNTMHEEADIKSSRYAPGSSSGVSGISGKPLRLASIQPIDNNRIKTKIGELDRVLSGGVVQGSLTLVGGDPGIGKSTLLIQICQYIGEQGKKVLYVSGEESVQQVKLRASRLNITTENLLLMSETNMDIIENTIKEVSPDLLIIDSIQTMFLDEISSAPGSVTQVRECTSRLMHIGKGKNISMFIVGHVTKDGAIAGPRVLEHIVDTVLYFEGERRASYRILRAVKNRFGSTNEIGVFEMKKEGLAEIKNPSEYMLSGRPLNVSGSSITCSVEGTRPILVEVQSLITYTNFGMPRRMATGVDYNRVTLLIAVLEKRVGFNLGSYDSYVNLAGGIKVAEPSLDASIVCSIASSYKNKVIDPYTLVFGEIGLTGEMRAVTMAEKRVLEAEKLGFKTCVIPKENIKEVQNIKNINVIGVSTVAELLDKVVL